eukprot:1668350-Prymnesium_polylepis.2
MCIRDRGETALTKRKKEGTLAWARIMIALNDVEMHQLMCIGQGRTNSSDPKANLEAKKSEIKKAKEAKAEAVDAEMKAKRDKKDEIERRAREMQEKASDAWKHRSMHAHSVLENDDQKTYQVQKCQQSLKRLTKLVQGNNIPTSQPVPTMDAFLEQYHLTELAEYLARNEWELRTMLNGADKPTFEEDFKDLPAAKRRKLQASLNEEAESLSAPLTPSPVKPLPRDKPVWSPGRAPGAARGAAHSAAGSSRAGSSRGGGSNYAPSESMGTAMHDDDDDAADEEEAADEEDDEGEDAVAAD